MTCQENASATRMLNHNLFEFFKFIRLELLAIARFISFKKKTNIIELKNSQTLTNNKKKLK